jgi:hypothetical protein
VVEPAGVNMRRGDYAANAIINGSVY